MQLGRGGAGTLTISLRMRMRIFTDFGRVSVSVSVGSRSLTTSLPKFSWRNKILCFNLGILEVLEVRLL